MRGSKFVGQAILMGWAALILLSYATPAAAWGWGGHHHAGPYYTPHYEPDGHRVRNLPDDVSTVIIAGIEYYFWEGMFYRPIAGQYVVVPAPIGAVVTGIPPGGQVIVVDGVPYYNVNGVTYMNTPVGYQVVPPPTTVIVRDTASTPYTPPAVPTAEAPVASAPATTNAAESFTINIPSAKGGYAPVVMRRSGTGFIGPQGEYYTEFPRIEQLKLMYAK